MSRRPLTKHHMTVTVYVNQDGTAFLAGVEDENGERVSAHMIWDTCEDVYGECPECESSQIVTGLEEFPSGNTCVSCGHRWYTEEDEA